MHSTIAQDECFGPLLLPSLVQQALLPYVPLFATLPPHSFKILVDFKWPRQQADYCTRPGLFPCNATRRVRPLSITQHLRFDKLIYQCHPHIVAMVGQLRLRHSHMRIDGPKDVEIGWAWCKAGSRICPPARRSILLRVSAFRERTLG